MLLFLLLLVHFSLYPNIKCFFISFQPDYDHAGLHRSRDEGITGFTGFHNQKMIATDRIPEGGEIFVNYGPDWFTEREEELGPVPLEENFDQVDEFLKKLKKINQKRKESSGLSAIKTKNQKMMKRNLLKKNCSK